jgi:hypothetical protein
VSLKEETRSKKGNDTRKDEGIMITKKKTKRSFEEKTTISIHNEIYENHPIIVFVFCLIKALLIAENI